MLEYKSGREKKTTNALHVFYLSFAGKLNCSCKSNSVGRKLISNARKKRNADKEDILMTISQITIFQFRLI